MEYKYCQNADFEDFASGRVIMNKPGFTNFPVRLAQEIFCRSLSHMENRKDLCIYDPCGGGGYLLTVLGFLNRNVICKLILSDINEEAAVLAEKNLSLLTAQGMEKRISELEKLYCLYSKPSHFEALKSADSLKNKYGLGFEPEIHTFAADILCADSSEKRDFKADLILTDLPYGKMVSWSDSSDNRANIFLNNIKSVLKPSSIVAIISDKDQKINIDGYNRLEKARIGKRKFEILRLK